MDLIKAMQAEYVRCKRLLYGLALPISVALFVAAVVGSLSVPETVSNGLAVVVFLGQVNVFVLREIAGGHQGLAEDTY